MTRWTWTNDRNISEEDFFGINIVFAINRMMIRQLPWKIVICVFLKYNLIKCCSSTHNCWKISWNIINEIRNKDAGLLQLYQSVKTDCRHFCSCLSMMQLMKISSWTYPRFFPPQNRSVDIDKFKNGSDWKKKEVCVSSFDKISKMRN
jgi:hypothetical protein